MACLAFPCRLEYAILPGAAFMTRSTPKTPGATHSSRQKASYAFPAAPLAPINAHMPPTNASITPFAASLPPLYRLITSAGASMPPAGVSAAATAFPCASSAGNIGACWRALRLLCGNNGVFCACWPLLIDVPCARIAAISV